MDERRGRWVDKNRSMERMAGAGGRRLDGRTLKRKGAKDGEMEDGEGKAGGWSLGREYRGKEGCPKGRMNRREGELQEEGGREGGKRRGEGNGWMGRMGEQKGRRLAR